MSAGSKSILIVDDDESILNNAKAVLQMEGYKVDTAKTGSEGIAKSEASYYNLALLDIKLPDMEGTELLTKMHRNTPKTMKVMITGFPRLDNAVKSLNMGADAYLMKPVTPKKLLDIVKEKLREQEEAENISGEKVKDWIKTRVQKLMANNDAELR